MSTNPEPSLSFTGFVRLVLEALGAANVTYLVGGAVAVWAWGEPRTTGDLDLVVDLPFESMGALSRELEQRDMLVPVDIMIDLAPEDRIDLPMQRSRGLLPRHGDASRLRCSVL